MREANPLWENKITNKSSRRLLEYLLLLQKTMHLMLKMQLDQRVHAASQFYPMAPLQQSYASNLATQFEIFLMEMVLVKRS